MGFVLGALIACVILLRWHFRQRRTAAEQFERLMAARRAQIESLQAEGVRQLQVMQQRIEQLNAEHRARIGELEARLELQRTFDAHHWLTQSHALRAEAHESQAIEVLYAGLERVRAALCDAFVDMAVHHFVLHVGLSTPLALAYAREAERCVQLAGLLEPEDRRATQLAEDVATVLAVLHVGRHGAVHHDDNETPIDESVYVGDGKSRPRLVALLIEAAQNADASGRFVIAAPLARRALTIAEHELGANASVTVDARKTYARMLLASGAYTEAQLQIEAALRVGAPALAFDLRWMRVEVLSRLGQAERALSDLDALLVLRERQLGVAHRETLRLRCERALLLSALEHVDAASIEIDAVVSALEQVADADEPDLASAQIARAEILHRLGRDDDSLAVIERMLPIAERVFGVDDPRSLHVRWLRALTLHALSLEDEALDDIESLLSVQTYVFGEQHPVVLQSAALRARIMQALGRKQEALLEAKRLLPLHASSFGHSHHDTVRLHGFVSELEAA